VFTYLHRIVLGSVGSRRWASPMLVLRIDSVEIVKLNSQIVILCQNSFCHIT